MNRDELLERRPLTTSLGASEWDEERIDIIGSNGATGEHYSSEPACSCGSVVGEYHNPECSEVNAFQAGRIKGIGSNGNGGLAYSATAWNGEGLPPVGTECEAVWLEPPDGGGRDFEPVLIKGAHRRDDHRTQIWFCTADGEDIVMLEGNCSFRPIRSDEDKVVDEMLGGSGFEGGVVRALCRALYRAGYRKLEVVNE